MSTGFSAPRLVQPRKRRQQQKAIVCAKAPSPPPVKTPVYRRFPIFGLIYDIYFRRDSNVELARRYGPVYRTDILGKPITVIADLEAVHSCFKNSAVFRTAGGFPKSFNTLFGETALFTMDGEKHLKKRATVIPAFSPRLFGVYFETISEATDKLWSTVSTRVAIDGNVCLKDIIKDHYFRVNLNITSGNAFTTSDTIPPQEQYRLLRDNFFTLSAGNLLMTFSPSFKRAVAARKWLCDYLSILVHDRLRDRADTINALRANGSDKFLGEARANLRSGDVDLLTVLCATSALPTGDNQELPKEELEEVTDLVLLLWFVGYTTLSAASLSCVLLARKDEDIWRRLRDEQDTITAMEGTNTLSLEQVNTRMPLMDSYISEVLRMYPPTPAVFREAIEDTFVLGHKINAGTTLFLDIWGSQRNVTDYPQPDELIVERFMNRDGVLTPPMTAAFGSVGGAHFCLGAALAKVSMKATLASLLRGFEIHLEKGQDDRIMFIQELHPKSGVILDRCERRRAEAKPAVNV